MSNELSIKTHYNSASDNNRVKANDRDDGEVAMAYLPEEQIPAIQKRNIVHSHYAQYHSTPNACRVLSVEEKKQKRKARRERQRRSIREFHTRKLDKFTFLARRYGSSSRPNIDTGAPTTA